MEQKFNQFKTRINELEVYLDKQSDRLLALETSYFKLKHVINLMGREYPEILFKYNQYIIDAEENYRKTSPNLNESETNSQKP